MRFWKYIFLIGVYIAAGFFSSNLLAKEPLSCASFDPNTQTDTLTRDAVANALGWVQTNKNRCGGYYLDAPFVYPERFLGSDETQIVSNQGLVFAQHGTSISQGAISIVRAGQQITAKKGFLYRDPTTGKLSAIDLYGDVHLREPNMLVISSKAHYDLISHAKSLMNILYKQSSLHRFGFKMSTPGSAIKNRQRRASQPV